MENERFCYLRFEETSFTFELKKILFWPLNKLFLQIKSQHVEVSSKCSSDFKSNFCSECVEYRSRNNKNLLKLLMVFPLTFLLLVVYKKVVCFHGRNVL